MAEQVSNSTDEKIVKKSMDEMRDFVGKLHLDEIKDGSWFEKLLVYTLSRYKQQVDAEYFRRKYPDLPADAVVQARTRLAARYAGIEGALSSAAYTTAVAATIGSGGGASPLTLPAGGAAFVVDMAYISQMQLKLAYDVSVLYKVPLNLDDPEDLWRLVRIAFSIKVGETVSTAALKGVPVVVRPVVKKIFSKGVLTAVKSLPIVGKYLLQRNIIKFAIPAIGVPVTIAVNYWTTSTAGKQIQHDMRKEARIAEIANRIVEKTISKKDLIWTLWTVINADDETDDDEKTFLHRVIAACRENGIDERILDEFRDIITIDPEQWEALLSSSNDLPALYHSAILAASIDGKIKPKERDIIMQIASFGEIKVNENDMQAIAQSWHL